MTLAVQSPRQVPGGQSDLVRLKGKFGTKRITRVANAAPATVEIVSSPIPAWQ